MSTSVSWRRRIYLVVAGVLCLAGANRWAQGVTLDLMTVAQSGRVMFVQPKSVSDPLYTSLPLNRPDRLATLFVSNSQSYAIMDFQHGDRSMIAWLSHYLNGGDERPVAKFPVRFGSEPNLRTSELLIKALRAGVDAERRPDVVIAGIVLDGLRWIDPRTTLALEAQAPAVRRELEELLQAESQLVRASRAAAALLNPSPTSVKSASIFEPSHAPAQIESRIQAWLDNRLFLFAKRQIIYGSLVVKYQGVRDRVLRIGTGSRRPISSAMYETNLELLELSTAYLGRHGIQLVLYFAPIRPITPNPYDPADIERFRADLQGLCQRRRIVCFDYSNLIPEEMWTNYPPGYFVSTQAGQFDYAHFTGRAHERLARQLAADLRPHLNAWLSAKGLTDAAAENASLSVTRVK